MIHAIVHSELTPAGKTFNRVLEEVMTVTGVAFETTASTLRLIFYHVYTNNQILRLLREEIASVSMASARPIPVKKLEKLPYITAVLTEGLLLSPGIASQAARVTDKDLFYDGWCIPAGTPVGMTTLLIHTDEALYPEAMRFNPDRWLGSAKKGACVKIRSLWTRDEDMPRHAVSPIFFLVFSGDFR